MLKWLGLGRIPEEPPIAGLMRSPLLITRVTALSSSSSAESVLLKPGVPRRKNMISHRTFKAFALFMAWVLVILPLSAISAMAQSTTGTLRGTVVDPNGG